MPDYFTYEYDRMIDGAIMIDNPDRTISTPHADHAQIEQVTDENAKALFHKLLPARVENKTLHMELLDHATFGSIVYDIAMSHAVCSIRFTRELTAEEITTLDALVEAHKNNT